MAIALNILNFEAYFDLLFLLCPSSCLVMFSLQIDANWPLWNITWFIYLRNLMYVYPVSLNPPAMSAYYCHDGLKSHTLLLLLLNRYWLLHGTLDFHLSVIEQTIILLAWNKWAATHGPSQDLTLNFMLFSMCSHEQDSFLWVKVTNFIFSFLKREQHHGQSSSAGENKCKYEKHLLNHVRLRFWPYI